MDHLAAELGVNPIHVPSLRRSIGPHDIRALFTLRRLIRRTRPEVLHTHMAKAGTLGRLAALLAGAGHRPVVTVHTFHGHVLSGYFGRFEARLFASIERWLARRTTLLIGVSEEVKEDLLRLGVGVDDQIEVVPLGFDLRPFLFSAEEGRRRRAAMRARLHLEADDRVVTTVARLVPIKRVDRFLRIAQLLRDLPRVRFLVVGDGELAERLRNSEEARSLGDRVVWAGVQRDMADVYAASDVIALTSDNEGTPVSLIEALAAGVPVVATDVGGVASVVRNGETGLIVRREDEEGFAAALRTILEEPSVGVKLGAKGPDYVLGRFSIDRLVEDIDGLYRRLLGEVTAENRDRAAERA